jgi:hypothetical protein
MRGNPIPNAPAISSHDWILRSFLAAAVIVRCTAGYDAAGRLGTNFLIEKMNFPM